MNSKLGALNLILIDEISLAQITEGHPVISVDLRMLYAIEIDHLQPDFCPL